MGMERTALQIGEAAALAGVSIDTVRYYERRGLIRCETRTSGGFRLFRPAAVERIRFIKQAQELGFTLDEIRGILNDGGGAKECRRVHDLIQVKLAEIDERLKKLRDFRRVLQRNLAACERELTEHGTDAHCPVVVNIEHSTHTS